MPKVAVFSIYLKLFQVCSVFEFRFLEFLFVHLWTHFVETGTYVNHVMIIERGGQTGVKWKYFCIIFLELRTKNI